MLTATPVQERLRRWDAALSDDTTDEVVDRLLTLAPFKDMNPANFPASAPLRSLLKNDTCLRRYKKGEVVVREGDYGTSAFMVVSGAAQAVLTPDLSPAAIGRHEPARRGILRSLAQLWTNSREDEVARKLSERGGLRAARPFSKKGGKIVLQDLPRVLDGDRTARLETGEFFGEMGALSRIRRSATIVAYEDDSELLEIRWQGLRDLMRYDYQLRQHIDRLYRQRALASFLGELPFLQHLSEQEKKKVADAVQFETYGDYDWSGDYKKLLQTDSPVKNEPMIFGEGDYPNAVVVIRSGFARITERYGHGHRTLSYLGAGGLYGLKEIAHNWRQPDRPVALLQTLRVIGYSHVLMIPVSVMEEIVFPSLPKDELPPLIDEQASARSFASSPSISRTRLPGGEAHAPAAAAALDSHLIEFLTENRYSNGTKTMVIDLDRCTRCDDCVRACAATHDNNPRFLRHGAIHDNIMIAQACMHCADPVCMIGCPTGAIHRAAFGGEVVIEASSCIGCTVCSNNCPYGAIRMVEARNRAGEILVATDAKPILKATKCDLCIDQSGGPACVRSCPHDALTRVNLNTVDQLQAWLQR